MKTVPTKIAQKKEKKPPTEPQVNFSESIFEQINSLIFVNHLNFKQIHSSTKLF